jgi:phosphate/sulfate permease
VNRQVNLKTISGILLSWIVTLPCAALVSALIYWLVKRWI